MPTKNNLDKILTRKIDLETLLSSGNLSSDEVVRFSTELSEIGPVAEQSNLVSKLESNLEETLEILEEKGSDKDIIDLANLEINEIRESANNSWPVLIFGLVLGFTLFSKIVNPYSVGKLNLTPSKDFFFAKDNM